MIELTVLVLLCGGVSADSHSLRYFHTSTTPIPGLPEFVTVGYVDELQIDHYDSDLKKAVPRQSWMAESQGLDYWEEETQKRWFWEEDGKVNIRNVMKQSNQSTGIHTWQMMCGCELRDDGSTEGFTQFGWDGKDLISFDKENMVWVTPVSWGEITKNKWDQNKARNQYWKGYLEGICIEWLKNYLKLGEKELRPVAPSVSFTRRGDSNRLSCVTTGFYPQAIEVTLRRDGVSLDESLSDGILPNHDGTYQTHKWTDVDPEDQAKFSCEVDHSGLKEKMVVFYERKSVSLLPIIVGVLVAFVLLIIAVIVGVVFFKKKAGEKTGYNQAKTSDRGESSSNSSANA
ncbi:class I histocompatibility antigen, F10 alpha chain-like [Heterodontus francisci]|uniref:class I histocompatibility antigen, F10 alpha chain-like n=1 Tax=Heterodontus francisci TaxID=7792 RepID=UPI00355B3861